MFRYLLPFLIILPIIAGCGGTSKWKKTMKVEEEKRQAVEQIVPEVFRDPLPFRLDRYEAVGFSDEMLLEQTTRNRALQDALTKLSIATRADIIASMKDYLNAHPVFQQLSEIDTTLSMSEVFFETGSKTLTATTLRGAVASEFWIDTHALIGRKGVTYCYAFAPKFPEILELSALRIGQEEIEKLKLRALRQGLADDARKRMNQLLSELEAEIEDKQSRW